MSFGAVLGVVGAVVVVLLVGVAGGAASPRVATAGVPVNVRPPTIRVAGHIPGDARAQFSVGRLLLADQGVWKATPRIQYFVFQWRSCDQFGNNCVDVVGANDRVYALPGDALGRTLRVAVSATNSVGTTSAISRATPVVVAAPPGAPTNVIRPQVGGTARVGQPLTAQVGSWNSATPLRFGYQWRICGPKGGACQDTGITTATYSPRAGDVGRSLRVLVSGRNRVTLSWSMSLPTAVVATAANGAGAPPSNVTLPSISGTAQVGKTLTASHGNWQGTAPIDYSFQWRVCDSNGSNCSNIPKATDRVYVLASGAVGHTLRVLVTATNKYGANAASSRPSSIVRAAPSQAPRNTKEPSITGTARQGELLTAQTGSWTGTQPIQFSFRWRRCDNTGGNCTDTGVSGQTYRLGTADVAHTLRVLVTASNPGGSSAALSNASSPIQSNAPPPPPPPPSVAGCPAGTGPVNVNNVTSPARLLIDQQQASPSVIQRGAQQIILRYHVSACGGRSVQGALVYATAVPYGQLSTAGEQPTNANGYAELDFRTLAGFPVSPKQQLLAIFVRARKSGENLLGGISTRRLFSIPVSH